jgi:hypothetical protein
MQTELVAAKAEKSHVEKMLFTMSKEKDAALAEAVLAKSKHAALERLGKEARADRGNYP